MNVIVKVSFLLFFLLLGGCGRQSVMVDEATLSGLQSLFPVEPSDAMVAQEAMKEHYQLKMQNIKHTLNEQLLHQCEDGNPASCNGFEVSAGYEHTCPRDRACIYRGFEEERLFQRFPLPKRTGKFKHVDGRSPKEGNVSFFYRDFENNGNERIGVSTGYVLTGQAMSNIQTLELFWDKKPHQPEQVAINPKDHSFRLNISLEKGNLDYGENTYLLRGNAHGIYYERVLRVFVFHPDQGELFLQEIDDFKGAGGCFMGSPFCREPKFEGRYQVFSGVGMQRYKLSYKRDYLGAQRLQLSGGVFSYQVGVENGEMRPRITFTNADGQSASREIPYVLADFGNKPELLQYGEGYLLLRIVGWEAADRYFLYSSKKNLIWDIDQDLVKKSDGEQAFPVYKVALDLANHQLIIKEYPYCCDEIPNPRGYEILRYDLDSGDLIDRIPIPRPEKV